MHSARADPGAFTDSYLYFWDWQLATGALASALARAFPKAAPMLLSKGLLDPTSKL